MKFERTLSILVDFTSAARVLHRTVLGPMLLCVQAEDLLQLLEKWKRANPETLSVMHADDLTISAVAQTAKEASQQVQPILNSVLSWANKRNMDISMNIPKPFSSPSRRPTPRLPDQIPRPPAGSHTGLSAELGPARMTIKTVANERTKQLSALCGA